jgi:hypothetical protein
MALGLAIPKQDIAVLKIILSVLSGNKLLKILSQFKGLTSLELKFV